MRRRACVFVVGVLVAAFMAPPAARATTDAAEYARAVAYWYLPTSTEGVYRMYRSEVVRAESLTTGTVWTQATIVTDRCTRRWIGKGQMLLACGDGRRERTTLEAELDIAPDLSSGVARIRLGGRTHVVRFEGADDPEIGAFERDRACSSTDQTLVAGTFANMERAHGHLLGKRLSGPYEPGLDHSWIERGAGAWCGVPER